MAQNLHQLVDGLRRACPEAVNAMVEQYRASSLRLAAALLKSNDLAEDAVQEAFVEALRSVADLREPQAFPGWLRQIVRSQANRVLRRRSEQIIDELPEPAGHEPLPLQAAAQRELRQAIRDALARLNAPGRQTAELFYFEERSHAEIAASLHVPVGTVKRRLHDARQRLRDLLAESGIEPF